jgi:hypothetical protein
MHADLYFEDAPYLATTYSQPSSRPIFTTHKAGVGFIPLWLPSTVDPYLTRLSTARLERQYRRPIEGIAPTTNGNVNPTTSQSGLIQFPLCSGQGTWRCF